MDKLTSALSDYGLVGILAGILILVLIAGLTWMGKMYQSSMKKMMEMMQKNIDKTVEVQIKSNDNFQRALEMMAGEFRQHAISISSESSAILAKLDGIKEAQHDMNMRM